MNKKFSTFLVAVLAFAGVSSVFGQDLQPSPVTNNSKHGLLNAVPVQSLQKGVNAGLFQLAVKNNPNQVLAITDQNKLIIVNPSALPTSVPSFSNTLWCVEVSQESQSQPPKFDYLNKGAGAYLDLAVVGHLAALAEGALSTDSIEVGGDVAGWSLSREIGDLIRGDGYMYSSFKEDSVIGFVIGSAPTYDVQVQKVGFNDVQTAGFTAFQLQAAATIRLTANEINTILGTQADDKGVQLGFSKNVDVTRENPFADAPFFAEDVTVGDTDYVRIRKNDNTYLRVDTSYANTTGYAFLDYKWQTISNAMLTAAGASDVADYIDNDPLRSQYSFLFTYSPSYDSLYIQVERVQLDDTFGATWASNRTVTNPYVNIQNIVGTEDGILTVEKVQNVYINLGFTGCVPSNEKTSVAQDLYLIRNTAGQYLAVPIYGDSVAYWVTLNKEVEHVEPWNMPAFQWVVEKTQNNTEVLRPTSPLNITNREFPAVRFASVQLYNDGNTIISALEKKEGPLVAAAINVESFEAASAAVKADPYVGYRKLDKDSLLITGYTLRYLHDYNDQNYIGLAHGDSVLYAAGEKVRFSVDTMVTRNASGVLVSSEVNYGYRISGLAQLKRQAYQLRVKGEVNDTYVVANDADRYAVSASDDATVVARRSVFFLKENNYKDGISYYALVDTAAFRYSSPDSLRKVGVADASVLLKAEDMTELRTSAFALEYDETPLYRRFKTDPAENASVSTNDGPEVMRFKEVYRGEYLQIESNPNFTVAGIDFLGIDALNKYPGGKSFTVDSAWVGRGLGYIKPQYLISIDRNDQAPVDAIPCPEEFHGYAPDGTPYNEYTCPHAIAGSAGFNRGKYLINFEFTGYGDGDANDYMWRKYYRAGFVDGVQVGDSLYILRDEFAGLTNAQVNVSLENMIAADSVWRRTNNSTAPYYIVDLKGDHHKFVTWSMRYVDPENYEEDNTFLIESMNRSHNVNQDQWIAPQYGAWLKMQNGCLVLSTYDSSFDIETGGDDALIFNVEYIEGDELATDDEVIAENSVVVIAGQGNVTVKNAAGKKVAISNILGQTVANTVVTSDNATIAVPAGVVVVAVEGEAAVKAIVK